MITTQYQWGLQDNQQCEFCEIIEIYEGTPMFSPRIRKCHGVSSLYVRFCRHDSQDSVLPCYTDGVVVASVENGLFFPPLRSYLTN